MGGWCDERLDCCDEGSSGGEGSLCGDEGSFGGDGWIGSDGVAVEVAVEGVELLENILGVIQLRGCAGELLDDGQVPVLSVTWKILASSTMAAAAPASDSACARSDSACASSMVPYVPAYTVVGWPLRQGFRIVDTGARCHMASYLIPLLAQTGLQVGRVFRAPW